MGDSFAPAVAPIRRAMPGVPSVLAWRRVGGSLAAAVSGTASRRPRQQRRQYAFRWRGRSLDYVLGEDELYDDERGRERGDCAAREGGGGGGVCGGGSCGSGGGSYGSSSGGSGCDGSGSSDGGCFTSAGSDSVVEPCARLAAAQQCGRGHYVCACTTRRVSVVTHLKLRSRDAIVWMAWLNTPLRISPGALPRQLRRHTPQETPAAAPSAIASPRAAGPRSERVWRPATV
jgi:hypothetical protein